jgi:DNA-binding transcriptional MerR regulator
MHISEFASRVDETPRTIRFYESIGILPDPEREPNDYRNYNDSDCDRVRLIRTFQAAGFALDDIARLLTIRDTQNPVGDNDLRFIAEKQSEVDAQLHTITEFRTQLANLFATRPTTKERPWPPTDADANRTT